MMGAVTGRLLAEEGGEMVFEVEREDRCRARLTPLSIPDTTAALIRLKNVSGPEDSVVAGRVDPKGLLSPGVVVVSPAGGGSVLPKLEEPGTDDILKALCRSCT